MSTLYEYYHDQSGGWSFYSTIRLAQTITPLLGHTLNKVVLRFLRDGSAIGSVTVQIWTTSGGQPLALIDGASFPGSDIGTGWTTKSVDMPEVEMPLSVMRAIVVGYPSGDVNHKMYWRIGGTGYPRGQLWTYSPWHAEGYDMYFEEWGEPLSAVKNNYSGGFANAKRLTRMRGW